MNKELREYFNINNIVIKKITIKNNIRLITTRDNTYVIKRTKKELDTLYKYLRSRSFDYIPDIIDRTDNYTIYKYIEETLLPIEEKAEDIINLLTLLHSKTTFYKEIDDDTYKELYENILDKLNYLSNYYQDIAEVIEQEEYMSPSHYLFIRNISKVFQIINFCYQEINNWYKIIEEKKRVRVVQIHGNLSLEHYLLEDKPYFISWNKSRRDLPIYDLINFYQKYNGEFDFCNLLHHYELRYPLLLEEKILLFCLISIPEKIDFDDNELNSCFKINKFYEYLFVTDRLIQDYYYKDKKDN